eukprot:2675204-Prymnesium_polylepis.1
MGGRPCVERACGGALRTLRAARPRWLWRSASRERAAAHAARPGRRAVAVAHANGKAGAISKGDGAPARGIGRAGFGKRARA